MQNIPRTISSIVIFAVLEAFNLGPLIGIAISVLPWDFIRVPAVLPIIAYGLALAIGYLIGWLIFAKWTAASRVKLVTAIAIFCLSYLGARFLGLLVLRMKVNSIIKI